MNSRERVIRAIEFKGPDRVPLLHAVLPAAIIVHGKPLLDLLNEFKDDFGGSWGIPQVEQLPLVIAKGQTLMSGVSFGKMIATACSAYQSNIPLLIGAITNATSFLQIQIVIGLTASRNRFRGPTIITQCWEGSISLSECSGCVDTKI